MKRYVFIMLAAFIHFSNAISQEVELVLPDELYLTESDGWAGTHKGWEIQEKLIGSSSVEELDSMARHAEKPATRALAFGALMANDEHKSRCYDILLTKLWDKDTLLMVSFDVYGFEENVAQYMLNLIVQDSMLTEREIHTLDSIIVFCNGMEHLDKSWPISRLMETEDIYERTKELYLNGESYLLPFLAEYQNPKDTLLIIEALREYNIGLDNEGVKKRKNGRTNDALIAVALWSDKAFIPFIEEIRNYETKRNYLDYFRIKALFMAVMAYDNKWAYNFIEETFKKVKQKHQIYYQEELYKAFYQGYSIERFLPLINKYGKKPRLGFF